MNIMGLTIIETVGATIREQIRFPRSKRRRIIKKWEKQEKNFTYTPTCFKVGNTLLCHPAVASLLRREIWRQQEKWENKWR